MGTTLNKHSYQHLIDENKAELNKYMPEHSLEKKHTELVLDWSVQELYERTNASELRESLEELVELKDYKDVHGKDGYYLTRQPIAWARARNAIENSKILEENEKRNKSEHSGD